MPKVNIIRDSAFPVYFTSPFSVQFDKEFADVPQETIDRWTKVEIEYEKAQQEIEVYYKNLKI